MYEIRGSSDEPQDCIFQRRSAHTFRICIGHHALAYVLVKPGVVQIANYRECRSQDLFCSSF